MTMQTGSEPGRKSGSLAAIAAARSRPVCLYVLLAVLCSAVPAGAQEHVGHVLDVEGVWYLDGRSRQTLSRFDEVPAGGVIRIQSPSRYDYIKIAYSNGEILNKRCRNQGECDQPILLPRTAQRRASAWNIIMEAAMGLFRRNPGKYSVHMVRSDRGKLWEAVVQTKNGQVDLAPVFNGMNKGTYHVRFERRSPDGKPADAGSGEPVTVNWDPAVPSPILISKLQPGLYEMVLLERRDAEYKPTPESAWFLVSDHEQYAQTASSFREAIRLTATWREETDEATVRSFLRAFLDHLALQPARAAAER